MQSTGRALISAIGTLALDEYGIIRSFDTISERLFGYAEEDVAGGHISGLIMPPLAAGMSGEFHLLNGYISPGEHQQAREVVGRHRDGRALSLWFSINKVSIGVKDFFLCTVVEFRDEESIASDLAMSLEITRAILGTAINPIITIDSAGNICSFNPAAERLFGYSVSEVIGANVKIIMPQPYHSAHDEYLSRYMHEGDPHIIGIGREVVGKKKDGSTFPVHLSVGRMDVGGAVMFVGILVDISERKAAEAELAKSLETTRAILDTAINPIITIDAVGHVCSFNPAAEKLFGYDRSDVLGQNIKVIMPEPYHSEHDGYLSRYLREGEPHIIGKGREVVGRKKDGSTFPMHLSVGRMEAAGEPMFVGIIVDITERKLAEAELLQHRDRLAEMVAIATSELKLAKEDAEAGARSKSAFLANMSHEIRTPMNAIIGFAEVVLQDDSLSRETREHVVTILRASRSLLGIINDILDVSKLESNKFTLELIPFHLPSVMRDLQRSIEPALAEKDLSFICYIDTNVPARIIGDPTRLQQILLNLVGNAIKFTPRGEIYVKISKKIGGDFIHFSISDTGIGMTESQLAKVFDAFTQADISTTRHFGGTGLGTTISKQLVEQMQGEIWVESAWEKGTTFHFTAHLPPADQEQRCFNELDISEDFYRSPRIFNILLAEDMETNASLAMLRLAQQGHHVDWMKNGKETLQAAIGGGYDLVLMDVMMPEMDGLEATRRIRAHEAVNGLSPVPIIALTASVMREDHERCVAAGMTKVAAKPIDFNELFRIMELVVPAQLGIELSAEPAPQLISQLPEVMFACLEPIADTAKALSVWQEPAAYRVALSLFAEAHRNIMLKLRELMLSPSPDAGAAYQLLHGLKGCAANLYLREVAHLAGQLDSKIKPMIMPDYAGPSLDAQLIESLDGALERALSAIDKIAAPIGRKPQASLLSTSQDKGEIYRLLHDLEIEIDYLNPDTLEPLLNSLSQYLPEEQLSNLWRLLSIFDFEGMRLCIRELSSDLRLVL